MSKSNYLENELLEFIFNAVAAGFAADTQFYIALHTADPGEAGDQTTNEVAYTSYARVSVARSVAGWTVTADTATNVADIPFPTCTGGSTTATHGSVGRLASGAGEILYKGALGAPLNISNLIRPIIPAGDANFTEA